MGCKWRRAVGTIAAAFLGFWTTSAGLQPRLQGLLPVTADKHVSVVQLVLMSHCIHMLTDKEQAASARHCHVHQQIGTYAGCLPAKQGIKQILCARKAFV